MTDQVEERIKRMMGVLGAAFSANHPVILDGALTIFAIRELTAERDRLRAALEHILDSSDGDGWLASDWQEARACARRALDSGPQE